MDEHLPDHMTNEYKVPDNAVFAQEYPTRLVNADDKEAVPIEQPPAMSHFPYRGSELHGVRQGGDPSDAYDNATGNYPHNLGTSHVDVLEHDPHLDSDALHVNATIVEDKTHHGTEKRIVTNFYTLTGGEYGPVRIAGRNRLRKRLIIAVYGTGTPIARIGHDADTIQTTGIMWYWAWGALELECNGAVFATVHNNPYGNITGQYLLISVLEEYVIEAQGGVFHPLETGKHH